MYDYLLTSFREENEISFPREKGVLPSLLTSMDVETETVGWRYASAIHG